MARIISVMLMEWGVLRDCKRFTRITSFPSMIGMKRKSWNHVQPVLYAKTLVLLTVFPKDRFLIHADHCLTYLNENKGDFPSWVTERSHNALVGCMHCQIVCPQNKNFLQLKEQTVNFSEEETSIILQKTPREHLPKTLAEKLVRLDIDEYYNLLPRNLSVLLNK